MRVGVIGTGDEGSVLLGAINPKYITVKAIADIRPYNVWRAFNGDLLQRRCLKVRPGLMRVYGWKTDEEARKNVKVYGAYEELIANAKEDGIEAVIIALPLHLHAPAAIAAMKAGLHVITEKLMGHTRPRVQGDGPRGKADRPAAGHRPPAALQHPLRRRHRHDPQGAAGRIAPHSRPVASRQSAGQG